jgi:hypothetical protein
MADGLGARVSEGVTVLSGEPRETASPDLVPQPVAPSFPVVNIPEPPVAVEPVLEPLRFQAVLEAATSRARSATPGPTGWVRYRRSLQVRWTIEAVNH